MPGYGASSKHAEHAVDFGVQAEAFAALLGALGSRPARTWSLTTSAAPCPCGLTWLGALATGR